MRRVIEFAERTIRALPEAIVRRRGRVALAWLVVGTVLLFAAPRLHTALQVSAAAGPTSEATKVERLLRERFDSPYAEYAVLVLTGIPAPDSLTGRELLQDVLAALDSLPMVSRTLSFLTSGDPMFLGARGTFVVVGLVPDSTRAETDIVVLRAATQRIEARWRAEHPRAALGWTGSAAFDHDVRTLSSGDAASAERRAIPVTLLLLLIFFGSITAALLPIGAATLAIGVSFGAAALLATRFPMTILLENIVTMLGLGVGIDYALLMVSRFREALAAGDTPDRAAAECVRHAGHAVALSGLSVAVGFAAMLVVPVVELRSVAIGGLLVVLFSVLAATTLLPGVLAQLGHTIDAGRVLPRGARGIGTHRWRRWGLWVAAHPVLVLVLGGAPVLALAWPAQRMNTDLPSGSWLPERMESTRAAAGLQEMGASGIVQIVRLVVQLPEKHDALTPEGWAAVASAAGSVRADSQVTRVLSLPSILRVDAPNALLLALAGPDVVRSYVSADRRAALIEIVPREGESPAAMVRYVRALRNRDAAEITGLPGTRILVGGLPALNADYQDAVADRIELVVALVIGGTLLALCVGFRSVLIPLKAVALNLLSVAAAFGACVLVFADGHGARWLGVDAPIDGFFPAVPMIVFCIVFGLSMDYEVFLVARMAERHRQGADDAEALAEGMARTGGVITSAALIMMVVFSSFALGDFLIIKILGVALTVAVFVDATLVRVAVGPALFRLAGRWNWWPGK